MKKQTKNKSDIKEKQVHKDYAQSETSPYREWLNKKGDYNQEHDAKEPFEANPDTLPESAGLYYQSETEDERMELVKKIVPTLTERQKQILHLCGNEGRTMENCAAILKISKSTVQSALEGIRKKFATVQK